MKLAVIVGALLLSFPISRASAGQCTVGTPACSAGVPHFVKVSGTLKKATFVAPSGIAAIKFSIYDAATGGTALWQEVQNIPVDVQGRYDLVLGATSRDGVPAELFTSGEPRWLGVQPLSPGAEEEPRVLMVSVPYALEASDAQTLGGLPASAFAKSNSAAALEGTPVDTTASSAASNRNSSSGDAASSIVATSPGATAVGTVNTVPKFASGSALVNSQITDSNGVVSIQNLSNIFFAERFPNGVPDAVAACPGSGCIIYANSPSVNLNLGTIDPGTKAITIYLGPYTYTVKQITLRKALKIIGMGAAGGTNGTPTCSVQSPCNGTTLQSINGNSPVFVIPQANNMPATNVFLSGFRVLGSAGNTSEDGFLLDTSSSYNTGLWYSHIHDVFMQGFAGVAIHLKGRSNDFVAASQWLLFDNVIVYRSRGGGNGLKVEGSAFELRFRNCEFDGTGQGDGTNIYLGGTTGGVNGYPISVVFEGLVSQSADTAVQLDGVVNVIFYASHHEALNGGYSVTNNTGIGTHGLTITDSYFAGNVAQNGGAGFALKITTTVAFGIFFTHNQLFGNPDAVVSGINLASVVYQDNLYAGSAALPPTSGLTLQATPAATMNINGIHSIGLNPSSTPITTIQSGLGPGEMVTFFTLPGGSAIFQAGGNIDLMGMNSVTVTGTITFVRTDLGGPLWKVASQWTPTVPASPPAPAAQPVSAVRPASHSSQSQ
jgi:hypothetical protein